MKRALLTACSVVALTGAAVAQTAPAPQPAPAAQPAQTMPGAGLRTVDTAAAMRITYYSVQPSDVRASDLLGTDVYNLTNENVGEIEDLILDNGKTLKGVVVSVGGFLGIGDRNVAIDPRSLVLSQTNNSWRAVVNTTKEELKNAPEFKFAGKKADKGANVGKNEPTKAPAR